MRKWADGTGAGQTPDGTMRQVKPNGKKEAPSKAGTGRPGTLGNTVPTGLATAASAGAALVLSAFEAGGPAVTALTCGWVILVVSVGSRLKPSREAPEAPEALEEQRDNRRATRT